jgi:hypothetical protein
MNQTMQFGDKVGREEQEYLFKWGEVTLKVEN